MTKNSISSPILLIGATGFTGQYVLAELQRRSIPVVCMVRKGREAALPDGVDWVHGDLDDQKSLVNALQGKSGLIFVASMGFGQIPNVINACIEMGIKRAIFTSSTAIFTRLNAKSKDGRAAGEGAVKASRLDWTILRPTMIYGHKGDRNMERLATFLKRFPFFPLPGKGQALQQPVFVEDVATAVVEAYLSHKTLHKAYNISGKDPLTFKDVVQQTAASLGKKVWVLPIPLTPLVWLLSVYEKIALNPKLKAEQLLRLNEDKNFCHTDAKKAFHFSPRNFEDGIQMLIQDLKEKC